ncbi:MAG: hypothetical protein ACREKK_01410 [Candidatus Methylomirabilales bacterium]
METLVIDWQRPLSRGLDIPPVAASMRIHVPTAEEASRVFNALGSVLRALTTDQDPPAVEPPRDNGQAALDPRDG